MKIRTLSIMSIVISFMPFGASPAAAQDRDTAYCNALADAYTHYLVTEVRHGPVDQSGRGQLAVDQCRRGDLAGIPILEKQLTDARFDLPKR
jgi:hypothetical protein